MLLLGLLLMAASGAFVGLLIADNLSGGPDYQVTILGHDLVTLNSLSVFLSGVALALIFCLGLAMMWLARRVRARRLRRAAPPSQVHGGTDPLGRTGSTGSGTAKEQAGHGGRARHLFGH
ncbi:hypothetical protein [Kitasatospora sp. SUK 42]|uniref:hypothetical protein n=1 Tax=Kitasatospora sp. SUK 42 TaxID=1588882 RepID=UPI0018CA6B6B|nr:hypothetical protein [Kitasatospora sp. SUK 42]MBV2155388.1 hypothetical protein [Kitasatospora sp. SUK 42]